MIGDFLRLADGVGGDGDAATGVGLDDVEGVVALEEGGEVGGLGFAEELAAACPVADEIALFIAFSSCPIETSPCGPCGPVGPWAPS